MRADVSEFLYRAWILSPIGREATRRLPYPNCFRSVAEPRPFRRQVRSNGGSVPTRRSPKFYRRYRCVRDWWRTAGARTTKRGRGNGVVAISKPSVVINIQVSSPLSTRLPFFLSAILFEANHAVHLLKGICKSSAFAPGHAGKHDGTSCGRSSRSISERHHEPNG